MSMGSCICMLYKEGCAMGWEELITILQPINWNFVIITLWLRCQN